MRANQWVGLPCGSIPDMQVQPLDQEDPPEKGMAIHSSILAWKMPWTEEPGRLHFMGVTESDTTEQLSLSISFS